MESAIQVIWWVGLIGALAATLVILKEVALILRVLHGIHHLTERTREAAQGIARNVATTPRLADTAHAGRGLRDAARAVAVAAASLERQLEPRPPGSPEEGG